MQDATETLTKAQDYVANVQEVLKVQNEAAMALQESIGDLFKQLMETRKTMSEDLDSLKTSSGVMSRAAESMGSVYEGSQAGLERGDQPDVRRSHASVRCPFGGHERIGRADPPDADPVVGDL